MPASSETTVPAPSFSYPRARRLRLKREFALVFAEGRRARGQHLGLLALTPEPGCGFKAGVVARKREYRHAVDRNRAKRRMRELLRLNRPGLREDVWLVVRAFEAVDRAPWPTLQAEFMELCGRLDIIDDEA
jgi:ribonuclease P protein component